MFSQTMKMGELYDVVNLRSLDFYGIYDSIFLQTI